MKILVTGGAGLVGSHVAEYFAQKKWDVIVYDNLCRSQLFGYDGKSVEYNWEYLTQYKNVIRVKADVRDQKQLLKAIPKDIDAIIHTAGQPGVPSSVKDPLTDFSINANGTLQVLEALRQKNSQAVFIYTSTNKVYGENVDKVPLQEKKTRYVFSDNRAGITEALSIDQTARTPYGSSKLAGDLYTQEYRHMYGIPAYCFRMSCIYGDRQFGFEDQGWVAHFIFSLLKGAPVTIYGSGKQVRDLLYVDDLARAFELVIQKKPKQSVFNIGGGQQNTLSLLEFVSYLEKKAKKKLSMNFTHERPSDQKVYISDFTSFSAATGWKPEVSCQEGIDRLYGWIKAFLGKQKAFLSE